jgi:FAD:protein FMN transferase
LKKLSLKGQEAEMRKHLLFQSVLIGSLLLLSFTNSAVAGNCMRDGRYSMGTVLEVTLCGTDTQHGRRTSEALFQTAAHLDTLLTTYSPDSPISHLNAQAGQHSISVPSEVSDILSLSLRYWQLTEGTFDITVGPLMALWRQANQAPSPIALKTTLQRIGSEKIMLFPEGTAALAHKDMALDLGGIGKGFALDRMVTVLKERQVGHALLDFGQSSQWALGTPPNAEGWRLLVRQPNGQVAGVITLRNQALSVSGSLGQSFTVDGQRYGHVIDPRTGRPVQRDFLAYIVAPSAAQAEALSKAFLILGESEGTALLERLPGVEGLLLEANGQQWQTAGWTQTVLFVSL